jgi:phosphonate transport system ATP-binding protein
MLPVRAVALNARNSAEDDGFIEGIYMLIAADDGFVNVAVTCRPHTPFVPCNPQGCSIAPGNAQMENQQATWPGLEAGIPAAADFVLRTESLEVTYTSGSRALRGISLKFRQGEFTVLLGASGAGKSTLLRCLNGLARPSAGRVIARDAGDLADARALHRHRCRTGMVFQQHHLIGRLSVLANVLTGRLGHHHPLTTLLPPSRREKELALAAIDRVGLIDHALKRADQLSGGQQQRVGVARALVQSPAILLADEPVASLDPATAERLLVLTHEICRSDGLTAVLSMHQIRLAKIFADRIIGLAFGAVVFDGRPEQFTEAAAMRLYGNTAPARRESPVPACMSHHTSEGVPA